MDLREVSLGTKAGITRQEGDPGLPSPAADTLRRVDLRHP
jgi:hypothetical protein